MKEGLALSPLHAAFGTGKSLLHQILNVWQPRPKRSTCHETACALHSDNCPQSHCYRTALFRTWLVLDTGSKKLQLLLHHGQHKTQVMTFPIKHRLLLPASVSEALEEVWVPSFPRWFLHTTACPSKCHQDSQITKAHFHVKRKKMCFSQHSCRGQSVSVAELWVNTYIQIHSLALPLTLQDISLN